MSTNIKSGKKKNSTNFTFLEHLTLLNRKLYKNPNPVSVGRHSGGAHLLCWEKHRYHGPSMAYHGSNMYISVMKVIADQVECWSREAALRLPDALPGTMSPVIHWDLNLGVHLYVIWRPSWNCGTEDRQTDRKQSWILSQVPWLKNIKNQIKLYMNSSFCSLAHNDIV